MKNNTIGDLRPITLPEPDFDRCGTVFEALKMRRTSRAIRDEKIPLQILSDILWAAQGINRVEGPFVCAFTVPLFLNPEPNSVSSTPSPRIPAAPKKVNQVSSRLISSSLSWYTKNLSR